jgi:predicted MFS family arabinose efflux permease
VPFCLIVLLMVRRFLAINTAASDDDRPLDWKGLLLVAVGVIATLNGLVHLHDDRVLAASLIGVGIAGMIWFVLYELKAPQPLMDMALFRYRQFSMGALVAFIYGMGLFGSTYLLPVFMQMGLNYAPSQAGLVLLPAGVVLALTIPIAGRLADRVAPYVLVSLGLALLALSFGLMGSDVGGSSYLALMAWAIIGRIGLGFVLPSLSLGSMRGVDAAFIAQGASTINFMRQLGGAIGVSLAGILLEWRLSAHQVALSGGIAQGSAGQVKAFDETFLVVSGVCAIAVVAAWRMRPRTVPAA